MNIKSAESCLQIDKDAILIDELEIMLENDEISSQEFGFLIGYFGD